VFRNHRSHEAAFGGGGQAGHLVDREGRARDGLVGKSAIRAAHRQGLAVAVHAEILRLVHAGAGGDVEAGGACAWAVPANRLAPSSTAFAIRMPGSPFD
jgi:hypothetical protein